MPTTSPQSVEKLVSLQIAEFERQDAIKRLRRAQANLQVMRRSDMPLLIRQFERAVLAALDNLWVKQQEADVGRSKATHVAHFR